jgi:hypothetical protein
MALDGAKTLSRAFFLDRFLKELIEGVVGRGTSNFFAAV